jgi:hypothetical protein
MQKHMLACGNEEKYCSGCEMTFVTRDMWFNKTFLHQDCFGKKNETCDHCKEFTLRHCNWKQDQFQEHVQRCSYDTYTVYVTPCPFCQKMFYKNLDKRLFSTLKEDTQHSLEMEKKEHESKCGTYRRQCGKCQKSFMDREKHNFRTCAGENRQPLAQNKKGHNNYLLGPDQ